MLDRDCGIRLDRLRGRLRVAIPMRHEPVLVPHIPASELDDPDAPGFWMLLMPRRSKLLPGFIATRACMHALKLVGPQLHGHGTNSDHRRCAFNHRLACRDTLPVDPAHDPTQRAAAFRLRPA